MKVLLFDFNNLLYKALAVMPDLSFHDVNTGGLYGFIQQVCSKINMFNPDYVIVCNDKPPYLRKKDYPKYKEARKVERDEEKYKLTNETRDLCLKFLKALDIQVLQEPGYEADDMIAKACEDLCTEATQIVIVSNDDDLFQVFKYSNNIYMQKNKVFYGYRNFKIDYPDLEPEQWPFYLALKGSHNGVPGLKGVGEKGALKILTNTALIQKVRIEYSKELELYQKLATLPYTYTLSSVKVLPAKYDNRIVRFFAQYGLELTGTMHKAFNIINKKERSQNLWEKF